MYDSQIPKVLFSPFIHTGSEFSDISENISEQLILLFCRGPHCFSPSCYGGIKLVLLMLSDVMEVEPEEHLLKGLASH